MINFFFFFSSRRRHTRSLRDWSSDVCSSDLEGDTVLYVGVGGGLEALQFAYCTRRPGGVIAVDPVAAMREAARANFAEAARLNAWFDLDFVQVRDGTALDLPVDSG